MKVYRLFEATNDVGRLQKKYRDIWDSVLQFERLLSHGITHGHERYGGLQLRRSDIPAEIWKSRVIYPQLGGKRSGLRYVYERLQIEDEDAAVALMVYVHQSGIKESEVQKRIRERIQLYDATLEGLRLLELADAAKD